MKHHSLLYPSPGSKWNITGKKKKKKEHTLNRDDFESDISPLSSFNKIIPVSHEKRKVLIKHEGKTIPSSKLNSFLEYPSAAFPKLVWS